MATVFIVITSSTLFAIVQTKKSNFAVAFNFYVGRIIRNGRAAQKMKFSIKDLFKKCDQILRKLRIWSHLLKKSLVGNFIFRAVQKVVILAIMILNLYYLA